jgi:hypothetical protein
MENSVSEENYRLQKRKLKTKDDNYVVINFRKR